MIENKAVFDAGSIKLEDIAVVQTNIDNPNGMITFPKEDDLDISFDISPGYNPELKKIRMVFKSEAVSKKHIDIKASFEAHYFFSIDNIEEWVTLEDEKLTIINPSLLTTLLNIVYSTSRGIIYQRSLGTVLNKLILPVLSANHLLSPFIKATDQPPSS